MSSQKKERKDENKEKKLQVNKQKLILILYKDVEHEMNESLSQKSNQT